MEMDTDMVTAVLVPIGVNIKPICHGGLNFSRGSYFYFFNEIRKIPKNY